MGCLSSQCSSRALLMFRKASLVIHRVRCRFFHAMPAPKPIAPPSKLNASVLLTERCPFLRQLLIMPMHTPNTAGFNACRTEPLKKGVSGSPFRNASRPERTPSSPESRTLRPYSISDFDHSWTVIIASLTGIADAPLIDHCWHIKSVLHITARCEAGHNWPFLMFLSAWRDQMRIAGRD